MEDNLFLCDLCFGLYGTAEDLVVHKINRHVDGKFLCRPCDAHFRTEPVLMTHLESVHKSKSVLYYCTLCPVRYPYFAESEAFNSREAICDHYSKHHYHYSVESDGNCFDVPKDVVSETPIWTGGLLNLHAGSTSEMTGLPYRVPRIKEPTVPHYQPLKIHPNKPYQCPYCEKRFASGTSLKNHSLRYYAALTHKECKICKKVYVTDDNLKTHNRSYHSMGALARPPKMPKDDDGSE